MYVRMSAAEFENILDEFRGTTEHTYIALIRYDKKYYISRNFTRLRWISGSCAMALCSSWCMILR